jgi:hypothetical protein
MTQDIRLQLVVVAMSVEVNAEATEITAHSSDPDAKLTEKEFDALPMAQQKYTEALAITPGVVRTMDGKLSIKGEAENQGMLLVDSAQMIDPVTGAFSAGVPLAAVETLSVFETPYNAQYGGFSGGLTTIETKAPPSQWQYSLMDFVPGIRMKNGHFVGISSETPRAYVGGPLIKNRLSISQAFDYTIRNRPVRGQPWPVNERKQRGFNSFTGLQAILSPRHLLNAHAVVFSNREQFADITSLLPQTASSNLGAKGGFATASLTDQFNSGTLNTIFRYSRYKSNAYGQGDQDLFITPDGFHGNAFNRWGRTANQFQILPAFQLQAKNWHGTHNITIGANFVHQYSDGTSQSSPIQVLREDGSLAERIDFRASKGLHGSATEISEFVQDHWVGSDRMAIDLGIRATAQTNGRSAAFAPRVGLTYALTRDHKTVVRAGGGVFYDRVSLLAITFPQNPTRVVTRYNEAGLVTSGPEILPNAFLDFNGSQAAIRTTGNPGTSPRNLTWSMELDRELTSKAKLEFRYLQSQTSDLYVVTPWAGDAGVNRVLGLTHNGNSHYREFRAGLHYNAGRRGYLNFAYLRSQAKGSLNTLSETYAPFEQPIIRPNVNDYMASDIPNRILGSGVLQLPGKFTISPVVDVHTGFRYSNVDVLNEYVGRPNSQRFDTYFSLDLKVYRDFRIPSFAGIHTDHHFRIGIYWLNLTNHMNARDVFNNVASPYFGHFVGLQHRVTGMLIDIVK